MLWDYLRICDPSLTEASLCGAYLYFVRRMRNSDFSYPSPVSSYTASTGEHLPTIRIQVLFHSSGSSSHLRLSDPEDGTSTIRRMLL